jgi:tetratricopeptide (TPR) repeat protein
VWNERCWARAIIGELQKALDDCNKSLELAPNVATTLDSRGLTHLKLGNWNAAIADYDAALRQQRALPTALYGRGLAKLKRGDLAGGKADMAAARAVDEDIAKEFDHYGLH